jgi:hypothetical protein
MQCSKDVGVIVKPRGLNGGPNASARSEVDNRFYFFAAKHSSHRVVLAKIDVANGYVFSETSDVRSLDLRIVEIVEIVKNDHFMPDGEQLLSQMRPDKACTACDQDSHGAKLATDGHEWTPILQL